MRKISCVIVLLMVLIGGCFAQSQPKTEQKANETPNTQSTATPQNSKIAAPLVSAISPSTNHAADSTAKNPINLAAANQKGRNLGSGWATFISASFTQNANRDIGTGNVTHWIFKPVW